MDRRLAGDLASAQVGNLAHLAAVDEVLSHDQRDIAVAGGDRAPVGDHAQADAAEHGVQQGGRWPDPTGLDLPYRQRRLQLQVV